MELYVEVSNLAIAQKGQSCWVAGNESKEAMTCRPLITMKQAKLAGRLALAESDPEKSWAMHILALRWSTLARIRTACARGERSIGEAHGSIVGITTLADDRRDLAGGRRLCWCPCQRKEGEGT